MIVSITSKTVLDEVDSYIEGLVVLEDGRSIEVSKMGIGCSVVSFFCRKEYIDYEIDNSGGLTMKERSKEMPIYILEAREYCMLMLGMELHMFV